MINQLNGKNIWRGIDTEFSQAFLKSELYKLYQEHKDELIIGVRNDSLNLYYDCDSIAKIKYSKRDKKITCEISTYYLGRNVGDKNRSKIEPNQICEQYEEIKKRIKVRATKEKKAQSKLVLLNNNNEKSNWYCIDVEYVKSFNNKSDKQEADFNARFDIIALSINKPHRVALIELKYGNSAIGGNSGIYKHVKDFSNFQEMGYFESHLQYEITEIVRSLKDLDFPVPFETPEKIDLLPPEFFFITLDNNAKENASTPKQTMAGYLFNDKNSWGCKRLSTKESVERKFGDVTRKNNKFYATFLFSKQTLGNLLINDIIDIEQYDDKVLPK
jgi:hypothetical protein